MKHQYASPPKESPTSSLVRDNAGLPEYIRWLCFTTNSKHVKFSCTDYYESLPSTSTHCDFISTKTHLQKLFNFAKIKKTKPSFDSCSLTTTVARNQKPKQTQMLSFKNFFLQSVTSDSKTAVDLEGKWQNHLLPPLTVNQQAFVMLITNRQDDWKQAEPKKIHSATLTKIENNCCKNDV